MAEYIKKEAAIDRLEKLFQLQAATARAIIEAIPAADVQPVRHGRWMDISDIDHESKSCSSCGFNATGLLAKRCNYCPNCGAKMDGKT